MFTVEQKVDMVMRYIATQDEKLKGELRKAIAEAINSDSEAPNTPANNKSYIDDTIDDLIAEHLKNVGMPHHLIGYNYAVYAIKLGVSDPEYLRNITSRLYPDIADKYNTTPSRAERAIRHAIEVCFDRGDIDAIVSIFGNTVDVRIGKLKNSSFISASVDVINRQMRKLGIN